MKDLTRCWVEVMGRQRDAGRGLRRRARQTDSGQTEMTAREKTGLMDCGRRSLLYGPGIPSQIYALEKERKKQLLS